jgi:CelD/BcsL family acetyltransferase involved in cellulose biosynthesis
MPDDLERGGAQSIVLERMSYDPVAWDAILEQWPEAEVFHGSAWLAFLAASQGAEPVVAVVRAGGRPVGYFVGAIVRRFGLRILGSPLKGWGTPCMGFLLDDGVDRPAAATALLPFAFRQLGCVHVELVDRRLTGEQMAGSGYHLETPPTYIVDLRGSEEELFGRMHAKTRQYVRKGVRDGLRAEVAKGPEFADEYYGQLRDVFTRQGLTPSYGIERVRQLVRILQPTGQLLLLRITSPDGRAVATGVSVGRGETAFSWGAASYRADSALHPSQLLWWEAIRYWRARGLARYDLGGAGEYKKSYGGVPTREYRFHRSRYPVLRYGRAALRRLVRARQRVRGFLDRRNGPRPAGERRAPADAETG